MYLAFCPFPGLKLRGSFHRVLFRVNQAGGAEAKRMFLTPVGLYIFVHPVVFLVHDLYNHVGWFFALQKAPIKKMPPPLTPHVMWYDVISRLGLSASLLTPGPHYELEEGKVGHFFDWGLLESKKPSYMTIWVMYKKYHRVYKNVQAYRSQEHPLSFCSTCLIHS